MKTIHDLTKRVEEAHIRHLKEVKSLEEQTRNVSLNASPLASNTSTPHDTNVSFESLVGSKTTQVKSGDDMFGSFESSQAIAPQTWSSTNQTIKPTSSSSSNGWVTSQSTPTATTATASHVSSTHWNPQRTVTTQPPSNNWTTEPMSPNRMNSTTTWNSQQVKQTTGWSPSVQSQQIPSLSTPPSFQSNSLNQNNNSSMNGMNFNALRTIPVTPQKQAPMMPLSLGMGLLQPVQSSPNTNFNNNTSQAQKMANLHAFDPLG